MSQTSPQDEEIRNMKIAVLCAADDSNYFFLAQKYNLDIYDRHRDCRTFRFDCPVITHAPCAQWSRMHHFARKDAEVKSLAWFCLEAIYRCGGIFEHPAGSHFFDTANIQKEDIFSVMQHWWGFPGRKRTYLFSNQITFAPVPLNFDAYPGNIAKHLDSKARSLTTLSFNEWLIQSIIQSNVVR